MKIITLLAQKVFKLEHLFSMLVIKGAAKEPFDIDVFYDNNNGMGATHDWERRIMIILIRATIDAL